jgi:hypothetical protein
MPVHAHSIILCDRVHGSMHVCGTYHSDIRVCSITAPRQSRHVCIDRGTVSVRTRLQAPFGNELGRTKPLCPGPVVANFLTPRSVRANVFYSFRLSCILPMCPLMIAPAASRRPSQTWPSGEAEAEKGDQCKVNKNCIVIEAASSGGTTCN